MKKIIATCPISIKKKNLVSRFFTRATKELFQLTNGITSLFQPRPQHSSNKVLPSEDDIFMSSNLLYNNSFRTGSTATLSTNSYTTKRRKPSIHTTEQCCFKQILETSIKAKLKQRTPKKDQEIYQQALINLFYLKQDSTMKQKGLVASSRKAWLETVSDVLFSPLPDQPLYIICDTSPTENPQTIKLAHQDNIRIVKYGSLGALLFLRAIQNGHTVKGFYSDWDMIPDETTHLPHCQGCTTVISVAHIADTFNIDRPEFLIQTTTERESIEVENKLESSLLFESEFSPIPIKQKSHSLLSTLFYCVQYSLLDSCSIPLDFQYKNLFHDMMEYLDSTVLDGNTQVSFEPDQRHRIRWMDSAEEVLRTPLPDGPLYIVCDDTPRIQFSRIADRLDNIIFVKFGSLTTLLYLKAIMENKEVYGVYSDLQMTPPSEKFLHDCEGCKTVVTIAKIADAFSVRRPKLLIHTSAFQDEIEQAKDNIQQSKLFEKGVENVEFTDKLFLLPKEKKSDLFSRHRIGTNDDS